MESDVFKITSPIHPFRGTRGRDVYGSGAFHASRDGGARQHEGLDFVAFPGDAVFAPLSGRITHVGIAYPDSHLGSIHIAHADGIHTCKLLYAACGLGVGAIVGRGDLLGTAQDVSAYWHVREPKGGMMINHVHLELRAGGLPLDPDLHLEL